MIGTTAREIAIEQALARTGSIDGAIEATGADRKLVEKVSLRMERRCGLAEPRVPKPPKDAPYRLFAPAGLDAVTALRKGYVTIRPVHQGRVILD